MQSSDNERIKAAYGNYNFWSWFRYWFADTANIVSLWLIDKNYYDYDYVKEAKRQLMEDTIRSKDEIQSIMSKFGIGVSREQPKADELQRMAMNDLETHK